MLGPADVFRVIIFAGWMIGGSGGGSLRAQEVATHAAPVEMPGWQIAAGTKLEFEVATVKADASDKEAEVNFQLGPGDVYAKTGGRLRDINVSLLDCIRFAYKLSDGQVRILQAGAPGWIATKRFAIEAKASNPEATKDQMRLMMQSLLQERFGLRAHRETRELPVLALVLARPGKLGPELGVHDAGDAGCSNVEGGADRNGGAALDTLPAVCGGLVTVGGASAPSHVRIGGRKIPMALLAAHLGEMAGFDRPVVERTGLSGTFDLVLEWGPDAAPDADDRQTNVEEALQDQLGLKLKREKAGVEVLVIDAVEEKPTEN
jgi:uncharacterized protein (TIGR03435 family)